MNLKKEDIKLVYNLIEDNILGIELEMSDTKTNFNTFLENVKLSYILNYFLEFKDVFGLIEYIGKTVYIYSTPHSDFYKLIKTTKVNSISEGFFLKETILTEDMWVEHVLYFTKFFETKMEHEIKILEKSSDILILKQKVSLEGKKMALQYISEEYVTKFENIIKEFKNE